MDVFILIVLALQLACYIMLDLDNYPKLKWLVLAIVLFGFMYAFPEAYITLYISRESFCGTPEARGWGDFHRMGASSAIILHLLYVTSVRVKSKYVRR